MTIEYLAGNRVIGIDSEKTQVVSGDAVWGADENDSIEDFTSYTSQSGGAKAMDDSWLRSDTSSTLVRADYSTKTLAASNSGSGTVEKSCYFDLGASTLGTKWLCRYKCQVTSFSGRGDTNTQFTGIYLTSSTSNGSQSHMGVSLVAPPPANCYCPENRNGQPDFNFNDKMSHTLTAETVWIEMIRDGNGLQLKLYNDAYYTTSSLIESSIVETNTPSADLRYLKVLIRKTTGSNAGTINIKIDDLEIWNGVTVPIGAIDVVDGSVFYTKDTNKEYILNSGVWTKL